MGYVHRLPQGSGVDFYGGVKAQRLYPRFGCQRRGTVYITRRDHDSPRTRSRSTVVLMRQRRVNPCRPVSRLRCICHWNLASVVACATGAGLAQLLDWVKDTVRDTEIRHTDEFVDVTEEAYDVIREQFAEWKELEDWLRLMAWLAPYRTEVGNRTTVRLGVLRKTGDSSRAKLDIASGHLSRSSRGGRNPRRNRPKHFRSSATHWSFQFNSGTCRLPSFHFD